MLSVTQHYYFVDGVLYCESAKVPDLWRLVVPAHLRQCIVDEIHDPIFRPLNSHGLTVRHTVLGLFSWSSPTFSLSVLISHG